MSQQSQMVFHCSTHQAPRHGTFKGPHLGMPQPTALITAVKCLPELAPVILGRFYNCVNLRLFTTVPNTKTI